MLHVRMFSLSDFLQSYHRHHHPPHSPPSNKHMGSRGRSPPPHHTPKSFLLRGVAGAPPHYTPTPSPTLFQWERRRVPPTYYLLSIIYYQPPTAYNLLPTTHYQVFIITPIAITYHPLLNYYLLPVIFYLLPVTYDELLITYSPLPTTYHHHWVCRVVGSSQ